MVTMPEATIHEYGHSAFWPNEIWHPWELHVAAPSLQPVTTEEGDQPAFSRCVAPAADAGH